MLKGGVCGGSLIRGVLKLDQEIEIRPGVQVREDDNKETVTPTRSKILSLKSDKNNLQVCRNSFVSELSLHFVEFSACKTQWPKMTETCS